MGFVKEPTCATLLVLLIMMCYKMFTVSYRCVETTLPTNQFLEVLVLVCTTIRFLDYNIFLQLLLLPIMIMSQFSSLFHLMVLLGCKLQCKMIFKRIILQAAAQLCFLALYLFYFGVQYFSVLVFLIAYLFYVTQPIVRQEFRFTS